MTTTVLIVDDHDLIREGLRRALEREVEFTVLADVACVDQALELFGELTPDVVITDIRIGAGDGIDVTRRLRARSAVVGIVVVSMYAEDDQVLAALDAGASAFVPKSAPVSDVVSAARHAAAVPLSFTAPDLAGALRRRMEGQAVQLSSRESDVLGLLSEGLSTSAIAGRLFLSESTVKTHLSRIYDKLGASNRAQALMSALRLGLIHSERATP